MRMRNFLFLFSIVLTLSNISAQNNKLKIVGAYNYGTSSLKKDIRIIAIVVKGDVNMIGDPDDISFINAETGKNTGYAIDDFSFLSPDGKEAWINLPKDFNRWMVYAVFITGVPKELKKVKLSFDGVDISDAAMISGSFNTLPPVGKRIKHR